MTPNEHWSAPAVGAPPPRTMPPGGYPPPPPSAEPTPRPVASRRRWPWLVAAAAVAFPLGIVGGAVGSRLTDEVTVSNGLPV
ncbi:MAG: hypothetical protein ACO3C1_11050, partial [Ilumatobacteraceae bacterium]